MGWEYADSWDEFQFVNYSESEELEDGRIVFWRTEDWEIYGPGGGGYTSPGPYSSVEGDLQAWLNSGSLLARDVLVWNRGDYSTSGSRPNFSVFQSSSPGRRSLMNDLLTSGNLLKIDSYGLKGAAKPFTGNTNPAVGQGDIKPGDIVVKGRMRHGNLSESTVYRVFDPYSHLYTDVAETYSFLELARREADANVIRADYSEVGGPNPQLAADFETIKARLTALIANLRSRPSGAYFSVSYTDRNGVRVTGQVLVSELISWLTLVDFQFFPAGTQFNNGGVGNHRIQECAFAPKDGCYAEGG